MRPIRLSLTAFGPFRHRELIDFLDFGRHALFLINGPTGSGKTILLDAICFALYGQTTGGEREGRQLRSDHAAPDVLCEVDFTFVLGHQTYRILRQPDQERPKKRGKGLLLEPARADFWRIEDDGHETVLSSRKVQEANAAIEARLGLNAEQFRQVIVLPQGHFRQLLLAGSLEREAIFSRLFQTHRYKRLEEKLAERASAIQQQARELDTICQGILSVSGHQSPEDAGAELAQLLPRQQALEQQQHTLEQALRRQEQTLHEARRQQQAWLRLEETRLQLQQLENRQAEMDRQQNRLQLARQAEKLAPLQREQQHSQTRYQQGLDTCQEREQALQQAQTRHYVVEARYQERKSSHLPRLETLQQQSLQLNSLLPRMQALAQAEAACQELQRQAGQLAQDEAHLQQQFNSRQQQQDTLLARQQELQHYRQALGELTMEADRQSARLQLQQEYEHQQARWHTLEQQLQAAQAQRIEREQALQQARQLRLATEIRWHQGQALLLARQLQAGLPCPVCGSLEHPAPAQAEVQPPGEQALEQARSTEQAAQASIRQLEHQLARQQGEWQELQQRLDDIRPRLSEPARDSQQLARSLATLQQRMATLERELQQLAGLAPQLQTLEQELGAIRQLLEPLQQESHDCRQQLAIAQAHHQQLLDSLPADCRTAAALEQAIRQAGSEHGQLEQALQQAEQDWRDGQAGVREQQTLLQEAQRHLQQVTQEQENRSRCWQEALQASAFASPQDWEQARLDDDECQRLAADIEQHGRERMQLHTLLRERAAQVTEQEWPALSALEQEQTRLQDSLQQGGHALQQLQSRTGQLRQALERHADQVQQQQALQQQYTLVGTLAELATGKNAHKISLQRFVLSVLLDDVLLAASTRFQHMSKGRYELIRKETRSKGNRAAGLDLQVADAWTGRERDVATLSGGESFMAALALALGMSDVIQGYAGGMRLETLFIDEGFGSLDEESLELAIRVLGELRDGGRMVGIISHVAELKAQIPQRLDVIPGRAGSRVRVVG